MTAVVVTDQAFGGVERERAVAESHGVDFAEHHVQTEADTIAAVAGARVVFVNFAPITRAVLAVLGPGAVVIRYGIGYDNVDAVAAAELGVAVCNVPDYGADTVADHTVALMLASLRRLNRYTATIRKDGWVAPAELGSIRGFAETTVGLIGTGRIGRAVARRLRPFGFSVVAFDPFVDGDTLRADGIEPVTLDRLLADADIVSLHAPLTEANRHLLGEEQFRSMRRGAVVVNTSRGPLIDEDALARALDDGMLGAAALDVFEVEPLPEGSPLRELPNVLLTPHAAFFSDTSLAALQRLAAEEADRALSGLPLRCAIVPLRAASAKAKEGVS
jgi:D-3-phosphoglycerate dehydrogenase